LAGRVIGGVGKEAALNHPMKLWPEYYYEQVSGYQKRREMRSRSLPQSGREFMVKVQYHKGSFCINRSIFCQEGYCSACEIYSRRTSAAKPVELHTPSTNAGQLPESVGTKSY